MVRKDPHLWVGPHLLYDIQIDLLKFSLASAHLYSSLSWVLFSEACNINLVEE